MLSVTSCLASAFGPVTHLGEEKGSMKFIASTSRVRSREADVTELKELAGDLCTYGSLDPRTRLLTVRGVGGT